MHIWQLTIISKQKFDWHRSYISILSSSWWYFPALPEFLSVYILQKASSTVVVNYLNETTIYLWPAEPHNK